MAEDPPKIDIIATTATDNDQVYYAPIIRIHIKGKGNRKFLLDTGAMSSLISKKILTNKDQLYKTGICVSAANSEKLAVQGITHQSIRLPGTHKFQEALFIAVDHDGNHMMESLATTSY